MLTQNRFKIQKVQDNLVFLNSIIQFFTESSSNDLFQIKMKLLEYCNIYTEIVYFLCPKHHSGYLKNLLKREIDLSCDKVFNVHLWASRAYVIDLENRLKNDEIMDIKIEIKRILFDVSPLLKEINKRYPAKGLVLRFGQRQLEMNAKVAKYTALNIFQGKFGSASNYPYFNYFYSIFAIRQALELAGNEIIGLDFIRKGQNERLHYFKLPWEFLKECNNSKLFALPFNPMDVISVIDWANSFTHDGCDSRCYVVFEGLRILESVFQYQTKEVTTWDGEKQNNREWSNVIYDYAKLKAAFEEYINNKWNGEKSLRAVWKNDAKLATILS